MEVLFNLLTEKYNIKKREVILKLAMKRAMDNSVHLLSIFKLIGFVLYSVFMGYGLFCRVWLWDLDSCF